MRRIKEFNGGYNRRSLEQREVATLRTPAHRNPTTRCPTILKPGDEACGSFPGLRPAAITSQTRRQSGRLGDVNGTNGSAHQSQKRAIQQPGQLTCEKKGRQARAATLPVFTSRLERRSRPRSHALPYSRSAVQRTTPNWTEALHCAPCARAKSSRRRHRHERSATGFSPPPSSRRSHGLPRRGRGRRTGLRGSSASCEGAPLHGSHLRQGKAKAPSGRKWRRLSTGEQKPPRARSTTKQHLGSTRKTTPGRGGNIHETRDRA